jgi:hypothetical protein
MCSFNIRRTINSCSNSLTSFQALTMLISLCPSLNKAIIHNIRNYLVHDVIFIYSNTMISNVPLTFIIILSQPFSMRIRIFANNFKSDAVPVIWRLCIALSFTIGSPLKNTLIEIIHISSFIKVFLRQSESIGSFFFNCWYATLF